MKKILFALLACWAVSAEPGRTLDGDTFDARLSIWPGLYAIERVRVLGVDTPELTGGTPATREAAQAARQFTANWLVKGDVTIAVCKRDSFGRLLGTVTRGPENLTELLLKAGLGVPR